MANKPRYEKSLIGQLFTGDSKEAHAKTKSPMMSRAKTNSQADSEGDTKLNTQLEVRQPETRTRTPEPGAASTPPPERQGRTAQDSGKDLPERVSPAPPTIRASTSPSRSQSPRTTKSPLLPNLTSKKGGKRIKIDLRKGNCSSSAIYYTSGNQIYWVVASFFIFLSIRWVFV